MNVDLGPRGLTTAMGAGRGSLRERTRSHCAAVLCKPGAWLAQQPQSFRQAILEGSRLRRVAAGTCVRAVGDEPGGVFAVVDGFVAMSVAAGDFGPHVIDLRLPGGWGGGCSFLAGDPRRYGVEALTDASLLMVPPEVMRRLIRDEPRNVRRFAAIAGDALARAYGIMSDLLIQCPTRRLAATLARAAHDKPALLPLSQEKLGAIANVSRKLANRALQDFREEGWISFCYRSVNVHDPKALATFARGTNAGRETPRFVPAGTEPAPRFWN